MKKAAAILLIVLYLFNWGGYRVLFYWIQQQTNSRLESRLDKNQYREEELIEFTIPLNMPYQTDQTEFERIDGEIVINGMLYHFVKQKVKDNQLIIKCIPNPEKKTMLTRQEAFFKSMNNLQENTAVKKLAGGCEKLNLDMSEYRRPDLFQADSFAYSLLTKHTILTGAYFETISFFGAPAQPPELIPA